jgi:L-2,4-diaminobutyrate transaminase
MSKVYFGLGGSDANETNVKLVWYIQQHPRPAREEEDHLALARLSRLGADDRLADRARALPQEVRPAARQVLHTEAPYYFRRPDLDMSEAEFTAHCAAELEAMIEAEGADTIAAFIGEPLLGTGGIVPPPAGYWEAIQPILKKYDILLIADEVVTGFGRLGTMFGSTTTASSPTSSPSPRA